MFDTYKKLMGKTTTEQEEQKSVITRSINFLLRPYRILFKNSAEEPKEVGLEKISKPKATSNETDKPLPKRKRRAGKILWRKR